MKYSYILGFSMLFTWGCSKYNIVNRAYSEFKDKNLHKFIGYRFVCDSLGDVRDLQSIYTESGFDWNKRRVFAPDIDKFRKNGRIKLPKIAFTVFNSLPPYDTSVYFTAEELYTVNRLMEINEILLRDETKPNYYKIKVDSVINSDDFKAYQKKEESRKKILVVLYPALIHGDKMILACRLYHTGMTSDAGSIVYQKFSKY